MTLVAAAPAHAAAMALVHAAAFPPGERWRADELAVQLSLPGTYGFLLPSPSAKGRGRGEATQHGPGQSGSQPLQAGDGPCGLPQPDPLPDREGAEGGFILARVAADEAEVLTLAVTPAAKGRGLGRLLLQAALNHAGTRGARSMFLEVSPANAPALALYAHAGFQEVGRRPRYYPGGGDALVLRRILGACVTPVAAAAGRSRPAGG